MLTIKALECDHHSFITATEEVAMLETGFEPMTLAIPEQMLHH